jgi:uncharacterized membrane protein YdbT with pleckstrin-like domain
VSLFGPGQIARIAPTRSEDAMPELESERTIWQGSPSQLINLPTYIGFAVVAVVATVLLLFARGSSTSPIYWWVMAGVWVACVLFALGRWASTMSVRYEVTTERLRITTGMLSTVTEEVELRRLRDATIVKPFFLRIAGLGDIHLMSADSSAPRVTLRAIRQPDQVQGTIRSAAQAMYRRFGLRDIEIT